MAEDGGRTRGLARRFRGVEGVTKALETSVSDDQLEEDSARWLDLAQAGGLLALAAARGDVDGLTAPAGALVRALLDVEEAQARLLQSIDENVKLLRDGPFKTGRLYLREANRLVESPERSVQFVERAQEQFYQAHALATEPMDLATVEVHIALAFILLGQSLDARHWLEQAYAKAALKAYDLAKETGNTKVIKGKGIIQAQAAYLTLGASAVYLGMKKVKRTRSNNRAQNGLREVLPLVSCIASLHTDTGAGDAELPALRLIQVKKDQYELVEVTG